MKKLAWGLVIIGALNWGLVGVGMFFFGGEINLVTILFDYSFVAKLIYLLVGLSAVYILLGNCGCRGCSKSSCKDCEGRKCENHKKEETKTL